MNHKAIEKTARLWSNYIQARQKLLAEGLVRSFKSPEAEFSEWLIKTIFDGKLPDNKSHPSYDVETSDKRIQVKSISKAPNNKTGYKIQDKDKNNQANTGATHYAFVYFDELIPSAIFLAPEDFVRTFPKTQIKRSDLEQANFQISIDLSAFRLD